MPLASYYLDRREQRKAIFKPYDRKAVKRDLHDARQAERSEPPLPSSVRYEATPPG